MICSVSPRLNEVRGAHDDEQQSARLGERREARAAGHASREGARRNVRPDAPNENYTIKHNTVFDLISEEIFWVKKKKNHFFI